jgi:hypothetical protein
MRYLEHLPTTRWALAGLLALVLGVLTGCSSNSLTASSAHDSALGTRGGLRITVAWPASTRVIPEDTVKIAVSVLGVGLTTPVKGEIVSPNTTLVIDNLPTGSKTISATAINARDEATAMGSTLVTIVNGQFVDADITMSIDDQVVYTDIDAAIGKLMTAAAATTDAGRQTNADAALNYLNDAINRAIPNGPGANKANFYWVLAKMGSVAATMSTRWAPQETAPVASRQSPWLVPDPVALAVQTSRMRSLRDVVGAVNATTVTDALVPTRSVANTRQAVDVSDASVAYQAAMTDLTETIIPAFTAIDAHLATLGTAKLALVLENPMEPENVDAFITVDYGDVCALRAVFKLATGVMQEATAYNLDPGANGVTQSQALDNAPQTLDANSDGKLTVDEYMLPAPFATLRPGGADVMTSVYANLCGTLDLLHAAATFHLQPGQLEATGEILAPVSPQTLAGVRDVTTRLKQALTQPTVLSPWMTGMKQDLKVDLSKHWLSPVTDLRTLLPDLRLVTITYPWGGSFNETRADLTTVDDPTFGGLFPNGLPNEIIYGDWDPADLYGDIDLVVK